MARPLGGGQWHIVTPNGRWLLDDFWKQRLRHCSLVCRSSMLNNPAGCKSPGRPGAAAWDRRRVCTGPPASVLLLPLSRCRMLTAHALVGAMSEDPCPVQSMGRQVVVTLPEHIDSLNADQVREQLLWVVNRGAGVLIADMTGTISCDYSGADALARAYHRAVANGTQLRLVVIADVVRRLLSLNGLDRLVAVYPTLEGAVAAGAERREVHGGLSAEVIADHAAGAEELLDSVINSILSVGLILQAAAGLPCDVTEQRITDALRRLDDVVREVRHHIFPEGGLGIRSDLARRPSLHMWERSALAKSRTELLRQRVVQTAYAVHLAAADTAALLEQRADLLGQPGRIDYPTEIKRWQVIADQAGELAERWEQRQ